ncbi:DUF2867 domain-containing protein [Paracidovorax konjaci]|uniref:DUF2867 domain-containing protein n=1 Tax=Paracidovorax konjaci TaxID=32040 RepID=A0A1I1Y911_9BURK|nr:DUF2867 domain-containing protein [Paracidovorax konjaci]SFE16051.1 Protein of unknown function [Paracidovorax konjaci]
MPQPHPPSGGTATPAAIPVPPGTVIASLLPGADFSDAYAIPDPRPHESALQTWLTLVADTPGWIEGLMGLRNRLVRLAGLRDLGPLRGNAAQWLRAPHTCRVGDRVGIFEVRHLSPNEVVMGQDDRHLDVNVSLLRSGPAAPGSAGGTLSLGTVVHVHNALGHAYMAAVVPFHRRIVRTLMVRASRLPPEGSGGR